MAIGDVGSFVHSIVGGEAGRLEHELFGARTRFPRRREITDQYSKIYYVITYSQRRYLRHLPLGTLRHVVEEEKSASQNTNHIFKFSCRSLRDLAFILLQITSSPILSTLRSERLEISGERRGAVELLLEGSIPRPRR